MTTQFRICLACLVLSSATTAYGQDDEITVSGERPQRDQRNASATVDAIKLDEDPRMRLDIGQHVDRVLGARVQRSGSLGRGQVLQLRGAGSNQVLVLLEDIQLSGARGDAIDLTSMPIGCLDQIEVLRGSAGASYGSGAQGGVLRLRLPKERSANKLESGLGSFGYRYAHGCVDLTTDSTRILLSGRFSAADGDFTYQDTNGRQQTRANNHHMNGGGAIQAQWITGTSTQWSLLTDVYLDERGEPGSGEAPSLTAGSQQDRKSARLTLDDASVFGGRMAIRTSAGTIVRSYEFSDERSAFGLMQDEFKLTDYSVDTRTQIMFYPRDEFLIQTSGDATYARAETAGSTQLRTEERMSGSVVGGLGWLPSDKLELMFSTRLDMRTGRDVIVAPQFNGIWTANRAIRLSAQVGRNFRDPSFDELYFRGPGISGNTSLRPEDGWSGSLSLRVQALDRKLWLIETGGYFQRYERLILFLPIDAFRLQASDDLSADIAGLEARVRLQFSRIRLEANYHYQWHRDQSKRPLPYRPNHRLNWLVDSPFRRFNIYLSGLYQGIVKSDRFGHRELPGYVTVSTGIRWWLGSGFSMSMEVQNIFDETQLFDVIHRPLPGRAGFVNLRWTALENTNHR
ncbi:MAG: TonB-dependent receptor [Myxococcota bacterium]|nr:TonB-dependent receptor [Myxococcota bacterium]